MTVYWRIPERKAKGSDPDSDAKGAADAGRGFYGTRAQLATGRGEGGLSASPASLWARISAFCRHLLGVQKTGTF